MDYILAGGAVVWRPADPDRSGVEIALVHRPRYDDWSLPKGKTKSGEPMTAAAVREVREETGVGVRLGPWVRDVRYPMGDEGKLVRYWTGQARTFADFTPNDEIDELRWVTPAAASDLLTYGHDVDVVQRFAELGPPTSVLLLVRHARAGSRKKKADGDDRLRPLSHKGRTQAARCRRRGSGRPGTSRTCSGSSDPTASGPPPWCAAATRSHRSRRRRACRSRTSRCSTSAATATTPRPRWTGCASWPRSPGSRC